jgi:DNA replication and repair protein RecF
MYLKHISLINFKNYDEVSFDFSKGITCFVGYNGIGKTNILDAVHYLSMCKSYLNPIDKQNIRFGERFFVIQGSWDIDGNDVDIYCGVKAGEKKIFKRNKTAYEKLADHIGQFPSVMISPYDRDLISEGSELRRKWVDGIISQYNHAYLDVLMRYNKVLDQRNMLLKKFYENGFFERESMEVWDEQLCYYGNEIFKERLAFLEEFIPTFQYYYTFIGKNTEKVQVEYRSQLNDESFEKLLELNQRKDAFATHTTAGIHKDDFVFTINELPVKKFGSQGQQKSFVIALRLAQFDWLTKKLNQKPILLLDDIFDKLDNQRVTKLMQLVSDNVFGQVLVTDTDKGRVESIFNSIDADFQLFDLETLKLEESHG